MSPRWRSFFWVAGLALCAWLGYQADWHSIAQEVRKLGAFAPLILFPYLVVYALDTLGWRFALDPVAVAKVSFPTLFRIRWSGESLNSILPTAYVGGEALKVLLLKEQGVEPAQSTAAAVISKSLQTLAQLLFLAMASVSFMNLTPPGSEIRRGMAVVLVGSLVVVGLMFWVQRRGVFRTLRQVLGRLGFQPRFLTTQQDSHDTIDRTIVHFYRHEPRRFMGCLLFYLGGWMADTLEIWCVGQLLGVSLTWPQALAVEAFIGVAKIMGLFIPGALGIQESGILLIGMAAGLPKPFCFAYAVIRRVREIVFAVLGWMMVTFLPSRGNRGRTPSPDA